MDRYSSPYQYHLATVPQRGQAPSHAGAYRYQPAPQLFPYLYLQNGGLIPKMDPMETPLGP